MIAMCFTLLTGCVGNNRLFKGEMDRTSIPFEMIVYTYDSREAVTASYENAKRNRNGKYVHDVWLIDGWAGWTDDKPHKCEIHVVKPAKLGSSDNRSITRTWGHELMHCVYGSYHGKGYR